MSTLLLYAPGLLHTKPYHPESHRRLEGLMPALERQGILQRVVHVEPDMATEEQLRRVHTLGLIRHIQQVSVRGGGLLDSGDTYATSSSYDLARLAAGGCCRAVDLIMTGEVSNGFALVRPPGHHAETDRAGGFCLFNNVAVAARQAQLAHGLQRVAIVDFDVHHGNGTQDIFFEDDSVFFASIHLFTPYFYPGIGDVREVGVGTGTGYTLNVPLPPEVGDAGYTRVFEEILLPSLQSFAPELLLVSIGFDAHWLDPLATATLSLTGYQHLIRLLIQASVDLCDGRILFVLEGGYQHDVLHTGIANVFRALLGDDQFMDPFGPTPSVERDIDSLVDQLKQRHLSK